MKLRLMVCIGCGGLAAWIGCGTTIDSREAAGGAGGGQTTMPAVTASSSSSGGAGGGATTGSDGGGGASGGSGPCRLASLSMIDQHGDPPPIIAIDDSCPNAWGSNESARIVGYEGYTGPGPDSVHELFIEGCQHEGPAHLTFRVPLFASGTAATDDGLFQLSGVSYQTMHGVKVTITSYGAEEDLIEGSFEGTMSGGGDGNDIDVSGSFSVCHVSPFLPP